MINKRKERMVLKMKISVLTPTYNRAELLEKLYKSIIGNLKFDIEIEWLIMDDGSTDNTKSVIDRIINENNKDLLDIKYFYQENQGKMAAINKLVELSTGELIVDCDSDDYFSNDAFTKIKQAYDQNINNLSNIYAFCFLKYDINENNMGKNFNKAETTMFDLYFKEGENGEKALVFLSNIRKKYKHELEHGERFITEARMYHKMDLKYKIKCINEPIMYCEYQKNGYTKNINKQFKENPFGYYEYFKEILTRNTKGITFNKRLYVIKHYILFSYLTNQYSGKNVTGIKNKILYYTLLLPGIIKSKKF